MRPEPDYARALVGRQLCGRWQLLRILGCGGMSTVFEALHRNGKRVAIKVLHPELSIASRLRTRFMREAYVANKVDHPDVVSILDDASDDGLVFLVMEYLEGETLGTVMRAMGRPLPIAQVVTAALAVLDVLVVAHKKGVIHRDVKPDNVFVTRQDRRIKLLDFGIASLREHPDGRPEVTGTTATLGTPAFMAPEQARGRTREVDATTDLWGVGATMFTLLTGRFVHGTGTRNELLIAAGTQAAPPLGSVAGGLHEGLLAVVDKALAFEKSQRWPDAGSMRAALLEMNLHKENAFAGGFCIAPGSEESTQDEPNANEEPTSMFMPADSRETLSDAGSRRSRAVLALWAAAPLLVLGGWLAGTAAFSRGSYPEAQRLPPALREPAVLFQPVGPMLSSEALPRTVASVADSPASLPDSRDLPRATSPPPLMAPPQGKADERHASAHRSSEHPLSMPSSAPTPAQPRPWAPHVDTAAPQAASDDPLDRR